MAHANGLNRVENRLLGMLRDGLERAKRAYATQRRVRETYMELSALSDRDLSDLNIARSDIGEVARSAAKEG